MNLFFIYIFFRRFGWDTVTALSQNEEVYSLAVNDLVTELEQANITCAATITFAETDFKEQLKLLSVNNNFILLYNTKNYFESINIISLSKNFYKKKSNIFNFKLSERNLK